MKQDKEQGSSYRFLFVFIVLCVLVGTIGTTLFLIHIDQKWVGVAETYFLQNKEIQMQIGVCKKIKCEGRATKADNTGLPVDFIVETEKGIYNITLWMDQNENGSDFVVAHSVTQKA